MLFERIILSIMNKKELNIFLKNIDYRQNRLKKKMLQRQNNGMEFLIWKLSLKDKIMIEELGYKVEPYIYFVQTKLFYNIKSICGSFLRDLHYAKKNGRNYIVKPLSETEKELLDRYRIQYYPLKYKIYLQE